MKKIWIYIVLLCIIICVAFSIPVMAILGEPLLIRWEIDNPYVNKNFSEWNFAKVEGFDSFPIPPNWSVEENDNIYMLTDDSGEVWAYGSSEIRNYKDLLEKFYNISSVEIEIDSFNQFLSMEGSDIDLLRVCDGISERRFFSMQLFENPEKQIIWILVPDIMQDDNQYDIAEAIVYSFAFKR